MVKDQLEADKLEAEAEASALAEETKNKDKEIQNAKNLATAKDALIQAAKVEAQREQDEARKIAAGAERDRVEAERRHGAERETERRERERREREMMGVLAACIR